MGRAFYRFRQDIALRVSTGQAFPLRDAELGALFEADGSTLSFLRGSFSAGTVRGLTAKGLIPSNRELLALAQPVAVQLNLKPEWEGKIAKDAATLHQIGRRLDVNSLTDELARKVLMFETWQVVSMTLLQASQALPEALSEAEIAGIDPQQEAILSEMMTSLAGTLLQTAQEAVSATYPPPEQPIALQEAVELFFEEEEWEVTTEDEGILRSVFDGENGHWMCYTQILSDFEQVLFYSICPVPVPAFALSAITEFICRVNAELSLGNFELDFGHSKVRFRTGVDVSGVGLAQTLFRNLVFQNLAVMDFYFSEIMGIIAGRQS